MTRDLDFVTEDPRLSAHSFTWVLDAAEDILIDVDVRVKNSGSVFVIGTWTMEVQVSPVVLP